jgi:uncharacterized protein YggE
LYVRRFVESTKRLSAVAATTVILAVDAVGCAGPAVLAHGPRDVIAVQGQGRVSVKPDMAIAELGAEARAPQLADAGADVGRRVTDVVARLKSLGIAERDISTARYTIEPIPAPQRDAQEPPTIVAYRVANIVRVRIHEVGAAGRILDAAIAAGANTIPAVSLTISDRTGPEAQARVLAVRAAVAKARELADAAGVKLGALVWLREGAGPQPLAPRGVMAAVAGPIEAGEMEIVVTVEAHFGIER